MKKFSLLKKMSRVDIHLERDSSADEDTVSEHEDEENSMADDFSDEDDDESSPDLSDDEDGDDNGMGRGNKRKRRKSMRKKSMAAGDRKKSVVGELMNFSRANTGLGGGSLTGSRQMSVVGGTDFFGSPCLRKSSMKPTNLPMMKWRSDGSTPSQRIISSDTSVLSDILQIPVSVSVIVHRLIPVPTDTAFCLSMCRCIKVLSSDGMLNSVAWSLNVDHAGAETCHEHDFLFRVVKKLWITIPRII